MIEKLKQTVRGFDDKPAMPTAIEFFNKINEIIELLNAIVVDVDGIKCVDGSKKPEPVHQYEEQRKWIGCICRFWNDESVEDSMYGELVNICDTPHENFPFQCGYGEWYAYCEPVKPDSELIYHGE